MGARAGRDIVRKFPFLARPLVWVLGGTAAATVFAAAAVLWTFRVDLFEIPAAWKTALELQPFRGIDGRFERAMDRLLTLQRPGYRGGSLYGLDKVKGIDGNTYYFLACFNDSRKDALLPRRSTRKEYRSIHLILDRRGRLVDSLLPVFDGYEDWDRQEEWKGRDRWVITRRDSKWRGQRSNSEGFGASISESEAFSIDDHGWVPEGMVLGTLFGPPVSELPEKTEEIARPLVQTLLASPRKGDLFRALYLLEKAMPASTADVQPLLSHGDPEIRARAIAVFTADRTKASEAIRFLQDPDARVRVTAAHAVQGAPGWTEAVGKLTEDPDRDVRLAVHRILCDSPQTEVAQASFLELVRARIGDAAHLSASRLGTAASAKEYLDWMEEVLKKGWSEKDGVFDMPEVLAGFPPEALRPLADRILVLLYGEQKIEGLKHGLRKVLAKIDPDRDPDQGDY